MSTNNHFVTQDQLDLQYKFHRELHDKVEKLWFGLAASLMLHVVLLLLIVFRHQ